MTRPANVPTQAVEVYPNGVGTPPGWDPQLAAVQQFEAMVGTLNRNAGINYAGAYSDWQANVSQYEAYRIPVPPAPLAPIARVANVKWADSAGTEHATRETGDAAWIWES